MSRLPTDEQRDPQSDEARDGGEPDEPLDDGLPAEARELEVSPPARRGFLRRLFGPVVVAALALVKFGAPLLKFFSIFIAVGGYALIWGWRFAVGFVALILFHELGHYIEAQRSGLNPQLPVFVPFLGAYVALRNTRFDPWVDARVSLAGPVVGGIAAFVCLWVGEATDSRLLLALAYTGFLLNLLNLLPVWILDGAQVFRAWRVLNAGGGQPNAADARRLAWVVVAATAVTVGALIIGMISAHVPQDRL